MNRREMSRRYERERQKERKMVNLAVGLKNEMVKVELLLTSDEERIVFYDNFIGFL